MICGRRRLNYRMLGPPHHPFAQGLGLPVKIILYGGAGYRRARGCSHEQIDHPDLPLGRPVYRGSRCCTEMDATRAHGRKASLGGRRERGWIRLEIGRCACKVQATSGTKDRRSDSMCSSAES